MGQNFDDYPGFQKIPSMPILLQQSVYPKYSKHKLSTVAHTIDCVCSKILNHGLLMSPFQVFWVKKHSKLT
jgi:hypothetical protein